MNDRLRRILVPVAFSANCGAALDVAQTLAAATGAEVRLFHVVERDTEVYVRDGMVRESPAYEGEVGVYLTTEQPVVVRDLLAEAGDALDRMGAERPGLTYSVETAAGHVVEQVLAAVEGFQPDLIVMPTHQRRGLRHAVLGSVTERVLRASPVPVVAVPLRPAG